MLCHWNRMPRGWERSQIQTFGSPVWRTCSFCVACCLAEAIPASSLCFFFFPDFSLGCLWWCFLSGPWHSPPYLLSLFSFQFWSRITRENSKTFSRKDHCVSSSEWKYRKLVAHLCAVVGRLKFIWEHPRMSLCPISTEVTVHGPPTHTLLLFAGTL